LDSAAEQGQIKPNHDHHHEVRSSSLSGLNLIITAGGTKEYLDPVRYLGNASSGQMGLALAKAACKAGAQQITLITTVKSHYEDLLRYADLGINVNEDINNILANKTSNTTNQNQNKDKNATHQASKNSTVNANRGEVCIDGAKASVNHDELMVNSTRTGVNHGEFNADSTKASINHSKFYIENTCIQIIQVESCAELQTAIKAELGAHDILIMAAAVADYRPAAPEQHKIKKNEDQLTLNLVKNPDILKSLIPFKKSEQYFVGFALESENLRENALKKLTEKNLDLIIANDASALNASSSQLELFYARNNEILNKSLRKQDKIINAQAIIEFISSNYEKNPNRTNWQT
jgi:phosphopantothenoylcysteine synthetase/decarboxylase